MSSKPTVASPRLDTLAIQHPAGSYLPYAQWGNLVQIAGVAPLDAAGQLMTGKVGRDVDQDYAVHAARLCGLNIVAALREACGGDIGRVERILMIRGFVNAADDFANIPAVMDGASTLLLEVLGNKAGAHARTSIGCASLPSRVTVEVDCLAVLRSD